ncbi:MAG: hypothetical protein WC943_05005 [Elusimicrobiota bacterium]
MKAHRILSASILAAILLAGSAGQCAAQAVLESQQRAMESARNRITTADRFAAAARMKSGKMRTEGISVPPATGLRTCPPNVPLGKPDYFDCANFANSPLPKLVGGIPTGGIRKFVDTLAGLGPSNANNLGNYIPVASPNQGAYLGSDYYELGLVEYTQQLHSDLPPTKFRGYKDLLGGDGRAHYLGPVIIAQRDRAVRFKFKNQLPTGKAGNLFLPVDTTIMGAGPGPLAAEGNMELYTQNRATIHLHGTDAPWISDGTPNQWTAPVGEATAYPKGVSAKDVPDMPGTGPGELTFYYPNQMSSRLMFYHDHAFGITRLNVYAGEAAGYLLVDPEEESLIDRGILPNLGGLYRYGIPLIIQDKTFVPDREQLASQDPTWDTQNWGGLGSLWYPHVYQPNQNPAAPDGVNPFGRWHYGPWFWPPASNVEHPPVGGIPATPNPSTTGEAWFDTPVVNGTVYPVLPVKRKAYRFRVLNASNDRVFNLQLYYADPANPTEVKMVPAVEGAADFPAHWPAPDKREGGVPDPATVGPDIIQIGNEGGFLPAPAVIPITPIGFNRDPMSMTVTNVAEKALALAPAERADIIIDFSKIPANVSKVILYNDAPAAWAAGDTRNDYFTGDPDQVEIGGAPTTLPGYGPNTRTIMQFQVSGAPEAPYDLGALQTALPLAFAASQPPAIVPTDVQGGIHDEFITFSTATASPAVPVKVEMKQITDEPFETQYGRMSGILGLELPFTNANTQTALLFGYKDPATEIFQDGKIQLWKITHNGIDTHPMHFHMFNVQVINRVDWAGVKSPPDPNEMGWKETVRFNMLETVFLAIKPKMSSVPFALPQSVRPLDPIQPIGSMMGFAGVDTVGNPITVTNELTNFGHEFVWHCHILSHEENDMMRPVVFQVMPGTAAAVTAVAGSSQAVVSFTLGLEETGGGPLTFTVTSNPGGIMASGSASPITVPNLTNGTAYTFTVTATNGVGSTVSNPSNAVTPMAVNDAPTGVAATAGLGQASVSFTPPANNLPVLSYTVTASPGGATGVGAASPIVVGGLTNGTAYTFTVAATNIAGSSPLSAPSNVVTPGIMPAAPTGLRAPTIGTNYSVLQWADNSGNETGFTVFRSADDGATWAQVGQTAANVTFFRSNAMAGKTKYLFRVQSYNATLASAFSNTLSVVTR